MNKSIRLLLIIGLTLLSTFIAVSILLPGFNGPDRYTKTGEVTEGTHDFLLPVPGSSQNRLFQDSVMIELTEENYSRAYQEIYDYREEYYGRPIRLDGYVTWQDSGQTDQFLIGRDLFWCCESDVYFIGFVVISDETPNERTELAVTGTLEAVPYTDPESGKTFLVPAIKAEKLQPAGKPVNQVSWF